MKCLTIVFLLLVCVLGVCYAYYDATPQPKVLPDLADFTIQVPAEVYEKHGYSDRTIIMYNLARFKELYIESTKQIQALQTRVKLLEDKLVPVVPDVNSVD